MFHGGYQRLRGAVRRVRPKQQARAGHRGERHRRLKFRIVAAARPFVGVRPTMIEDVFALGMRFHVAGNGTLQNALAVAGGIDAADVKVTLEVREVVLTGMVATAAEIERATAVARALAGARPVRNDIKVA